MVTEKEIAKDVVLFQTREQQNRRTLFRFELEVRKLRQVTFTLSCEGSDNMALEDRRMESKTEVPPNKRVQLGVISQQDVSKGWRLALKYRCVSARLGGWLGSARVRRGANGTTLARS